MNQVRKIEHESGRTPAVVEKGHWYRFMVPVGTRANRTHAKSSLLYVLHSTEQTPHDEIGPAGVNWVCRTRFGISVWATLESCIERGLLTRVTETSGLDEALEDETARAEHLRPPEERRGSLTVSENAIREVVRRLDRKREPFEIGYTTPGGNTIWAIGEPVKDAEDGRYRVRFEYRDDD